MSEEIEPKKQMSVFEAIDKFFEIEQNRMQRIREQLDKSFINMYRVNKFPVIKMGTIDEFQKSIEEFKQTNPKANVTARAYVFSSNEPEKNKVFEYSDKQEQKKIGAKQIKPQLKKPRKKK